jgi:hypothetical protein
MGQVLHGSATTTEAIRRAIHNSEESLRTLSRRERRERGNFALPIVCQTAWFRHLPTFDVFPKSRNSSCGRSRTNAEVLMLILATRVELAAGMEQKFRRGCHTGGFWIVMV